VKVKFVSLHFIKTQRRLEVKIHSFLISAPDGGEWPVSCHHRFSPGEKMCRLPHEWEAGWNLETVWPLRK